MMPDYYLITKSEIEMSVTAKQFYRRQLPSTCIDFASELGKKLFKESLLDGTAEVYFKLAAQFRTQDEPAFCGLSTLVMVLNALEVDPGRVWKAPWRFYHESMLDCCVPLENVKRTGINMDQFNCLANCNRLHCSVSYAQETPQYLDEFRRSVESSVKSDKQIIVVSYDRSVLGQTGSGHFSPLAAYHRSTDSVLIMDVARFKYPPHWVSLQLLQQAMYSIDKSSKKHRGYLELSLREGTRPLVMFGLKANISTNDANFANSAIIWKEFLLCDVLADPDEEFQLSCRKFGQCFAPHALCCTQKIMDQNDKKTCCKESAECQLEACQQICTEMRKTKFASVFASGAVAALMIAWPYEMGYSERNDKLAQQANEEKSRFSIDTRNEIDQLSVQLSMLIACSKPPPILDRTKSTTSRCSRAVVTNGTTEPCSCQNDVHL